MIFLMLSLFVLFLFVGVPIAFTLGLISMLVMQLNGYPLTLIAQRLFVGLQFPFNGPSSFYPRWKHHELYWHHRQTLEFCKESYRA